MFGNALQKSILICILAALAIFILDWVTPHGVADAILYTVVILISLQPGDRRPVVGALVVCTLFTITGFLLSPESPGLEIWKSLLNRAFAMIAFWIVGLVGLRHIQGEEKLQESERRYRSVLGSMLEGAQIIGFDWRYHYVNEVVASQGRQTRENLLGHTMMEMYPGIEDTELFATLRRCMEERIPHLMENEFVFPDGARGWFELSIQPVQEGLFILSNDITERKQIEAALKTSEERFRLIVEAAPSAIISVDDDGRINLANTRAQQLFGYESNELLGRPAEMLLPERFRSRHVEHRQNFLRQPSSRAMGAGRDLFCVHKDGHEVPVEIGLTPYETSEGFFTLALIVDITGRKDAELALKKVHEQLEQRVAERTAELSNSEVRFRGLFEHTPISIWEEDFSAVRQYIDNLRGAGVVDFSAYFDSHSEELANCAAQVKILDVNRATLKMYQAEGKAQLLTDLSKVFGPESLLPFKEELIALAGGRTTFECETVNYTPSGGRLFIFLRLTVAPGYEETWAKVFVGIIDITKRRQAEAALAAERDLLQALMDNIPDTIYFKDTASRFTRVNRAQVEVLGLASPEEAIGKTDLDFQAAELAQTFHDEEQHIIRNGLPLIDRIEFNPTPDGKPRWFSATKIPIRDENGGIVGIVGISRDITERKMVEEAMRQSEERLRLVSWATKDAVWDWDLRTNQIQWGAGLQKTFHYPPETIQTDHLWWLDHIHPQDKDKVERSIRQALDAGLEFWSKEYRFQRSDATYADIMDRGYILRDNAGKPYRLIGAMMDITERKYLEANLLQANEKMAGFLNELQQRNREIALLNEMGRLLQSCKSAQDAYAVISDVTPQLFPHTAGALYLLNAQRTFANAVADWGNLPVTERTFEPDACAALRRGATQPLIENRGPRCLHFSEPAPAFTYCLPVQVQDEIIGVFHLQSASEEHLNESKRQFAYAVVEQAVMALSNLRLRETLRDQSIRDPLTGLFNRRYMEETLKREVSRVTRQLHPLGIIMIDIDHFKQFNDAHGHAAGDAILRELGRFLQTHIRGEDVACRYGGEEFILILPDTSLETAFRRAEHLRAAALGIRVRDNGQSHEGITLSLGVAIYPEHGRTIETVMRAADAALYRAKQNGRNLVVAAEVIE